MQRFSFINKRFLKANCLCLLFVMLFTAQSSYSYEVGGQPISIPPPDEFVEATSEMGLVWKMVQAVQSDNRTIAFYIPSSERKAALTSQAVNLDRNFSIQVSRKLEERDYTEEDLKQTKEEVRTIIASNQADEIQEKAITQANGDVSKVAGFDLNLKQTSNLFLPFHVEEDNQFSYSEISTEEYTNVDGKKINSQTTTTSSAIVVKGKLLFCYVLGTGVDLNWSRQVAKKWVDAILKANIDN